MKPDDLIVITGGGGGQRFWEGAVEVCNLATDTDGMGFMERFRIACLHSLAVTTHRVEAPYQTGERRYFMFASACAYNRLLQKDPKVRALK